MRPNISFPFPVVRGLTATLIVAVLGLAAPSELFSSPCTVPSEDDKDDTVVLGVLKPLPGHDDLTYQPGETNVVNETLDYLQRALPHRRTDVRYYSPAELAEAVKARTVSFALMSSGQYVELTRYGLYPLASLKTARYPNPNRVSGALFVARADRGDLSTLEDMAGLRAGYNYKGNFINYQIPRARIARAGFDPDTFFSKEVFTDNHPRRILDLLLEDRIDVGVFRVCELEALVEREPTLAGKFRAVAAVGDEGEVCKRSTELYPGWTMTVTAGVDPAWTSELTEVLLRMPPSVDGGVSWSIATEFGRVNEVFREIKEGPYRYLRAWTLQRIVHEYGAILVALLVGLGFWVWHWLNVERLAQERARHLSDAYLALQNSAEAAERAEARLAALSRIGVLNGLSGIFAHEMGQPLSAIGYRVQAVKATVRRLVLSADEEPMRERILENVRAVESLNERAGRILEKVRDYAKGRASKRGPVRIDLLFEAVLKELGKGRELSGRTLKVRAFPVLTVVGDELELHFALLNVLKNAFEAAEADSSSTSPSPQGGSADEDARAPTRSPGLVEVSLTSEAGEAVLVCRNDGPLVDEKSLEAYLSPFGSRKKNGIGLGILLVRSIVEAHGGRARFEPRSRGGLVVTLKLPLYAVREKSHER